MRIKLDENFGRRCAEVLVAAGHEVTTVAEQGMAGAPDEDLIQVCADEGRCLLTLDLDFANPLRFEPKSHSGIAVVRLPSKPCRDDLVVAVQTFVAALLNEAIKQKLWIVETGRIRVYRPEE